MHSRPFYVLACVLAVVAVVLAVMTKTEAGLAARWSDYAAKVLEGEGREALWLAAKTAAIWSDRLGYAGEVVWVLAAGGWGCSLWRREGGWMAVPLLLLIVAGILQLLMV
jgi:hypothetical protein